MKSPHFLTVQPEVNLLRTLLAAFLLGTGLTAKAAPKAVSKWGVFENTYRSSMTYDNSPDEARLTAEFVSPSGRTNRIHGFWDGGSKWGVRFRPNELGHWTYTTECSDARNTGLHGKSGKFLCTVQSLRTRLQQHGPMVAPLGMATFEHADGTPFFWIADDVWEGARKSSRKEWDEYVRMRSAQGFNTAAWRACPGTDDRNRSAFKGTNPIVLNPGFLGNLDEKIIRLNDSDMLSAIAPLWEIGIAEEDLLPESQVIVLLRQMVARWDAYSVVWVIAFDADADGRHAARWRRIGRSVFDRVNHSPVILFCGSDQWALKEFSSESWLNGVAFKSGNDVSEGAGLWLARGPASTLWREEPVRPILNLSPATEAGFTADGTVINSSQAIRSMARSLFVAPPAGLCYQNQAIAQWNQTVDTNTVAATGTELTEWQKSLHLPGARRAVQMAQFLMGQEFYRLKPAESILLPPPKGTSNPAPVTALAARSRDLALIYLPEGQTARIAANTLQNGLKGSYLSLETGLTQQAVPDQSDVSSNFSAPGPGDWLLLLAP